MGTQYPPSFVWSTVSCLTPSTVLISIRVEELAPAPEGHHAKTEYVSVAGISNSYLAEPSAAAGRQVVVSVDVFPLVRRLPTRSLKSLARGIVHRLRVVREIFFRQFWTVSQRALRRGFGLPQHVRDLPRVHLSPFRLRCAFVVRRPGGFFSRSFLLRGFLRCSSRPPGSYFPFRVRSSRHLPGWWSPPPS